MQILYGYSEQINGSSQKKKLTEGRNYSLFFGDNERNGEYI